MNSFFFTKKNSFFLIKNKNSKWRLQKIKIHTIVIYCRHRFEIAHTYIHTNDVYKSPRCLTNREEVRQMPCHSFDGYTCLKKLSK